VRWAKEGRKEHLPRLFLAIHIDKKQGGKIPLRRERVEKILLVTRKFREQATLLRGSNASSEQARETGGPPPGDAKAHKEDRHT